MVGGSNIDIIKNRVKNSNVAGVLVASEHHYNTFGGNNIDIINNELDNICLNDKNTHPAILIYGRAANILEKEDGNEKNNDTNHKYTFSNINIHKNNISDNDCVGNIRLGPNLENIIITKNKINSKKNNPAIIFDRNDNSNTTIQENMYNKSESIFNTSILY